MKGQGQRRGKGRARARLFVFLQLHNTCLTFLQFFQVTGVQEE